MDPLTGVGTLVGSHGSLPGIVVGLDFTPDGILYGTTQGGGALVTINTATGAAAVVFTIPFSAIGDVTVSPDGTLLGTFAPGLLVKIDPTSGTTTLIGNIPPMSTLDFEPISGTLFGLSNGPPENVLS